MISTKRYWSLLKTMLNGRKVRHIPPLFHKNKHVTDFKEKIDIFDLFFAEQCSLISNRNVLPPELTLLTDNTLASCDISKTDILKEINNQHSSKVHAYDTSSFCMLKLCCELSWRALNIIIKICLCTGKFRLEQK